MTANNQETRGLAHGIVGSARVTAFGTSIVAPAASVITALVIVVSYAGFASPRWPFSRRPRSRMASSPESPTR